MKILYYILLYIFLTGCQNINRLEQMEEKAETIDDKHNQYMVIIINLKNPVNKLSLTEIKNLYLGKKRYWKNKSAVQAIHFPKETPEREFISTLLFKRSSYRMQRYWIRAIEKGLPITPPIEIMRPERKLAYVNRNKNAIAYVRLKDFIYFGEQDKYKVKPVTINGSSKLFKKNTNKKYTSIIFF